MSLNESKDFLGSRPVDMLFEFKELVALTSLLEIFPKWWILMKFKLQQDGFPPEKIVKIEEMLHLASKAKHRLHNRIKKVREHGQ